VAAGRVAAGPMLVLLKAGAAFVGATLGLEATLAVCGARTLCFFRQDFAIPNLLALVDPTIALPLVVVVASRVAAGPVIVLPVTSAALFQAALGRTAILAIP